MGQVETWPTFCAKAIDGARSHITRARHSVPLLYCGCCAGGCACWLLLQPGLQIGFLVGAKINAAVDLLEGEFQGAVRGRDFMAGEEGLDLIAFCGVAENSGIPHQI